MRRWSLRTRLTVVYAGLFIAMAAVLLGVNYTLLSQNLPPFPTNQVFEVSDGAGGGAGGPGNGTIVTGGPTTGRIGIIATDFHNETLKQMVVQSGIALLIGALIAGGLGWLFAGRVVDSVKTVTFQARRMSERNLHERIELAGPQDEMKDLADTFNAMLARLDAAFEGQRLFVANASHELRTPLAITRTAVDVQLQRARPSQEQWRAMADLVLQSTARSERLIDSLLLLARIEQGINRRESVDAGAVVTEAAAEAEPEAARRGVSLSVAAGAPDLIVSGDPDLLRRLAGNLLENGVRHNHRGGWLRATVARRAGAVELSVANSGEVLSAATARDIVQPFNRGTSTRGAGGSGTGLGLSIVKSIAEAHGGSLSLAPRAEGGLEVTVVLPT